MNVLRTHKLRWLLALAIALVALPLASCSKKDDNPVAPSTPALEKTPVIKAITLDTLLTSTSAGSGNYDYGPTFTVSRAGNVTRLACKMPAAGTYKVTLWGNLATTPSVLASADIVQAGAGQIAYKTITPVALATGQTYLIAIHSSGQWYEIRRQGGGALPYPLTSGSVQLTGYQWISNGTASPVFPTNVDATYISGFADFDFQPN